MRRNKYKNNFRVIFLLVLFASSATVGAAQSVSNGSEAAFDYVRMKRSVARQFWRKENASTQELKAAIGLLREILVYLDQPEIRSLQETHQNLKSRRADVRYEMAKALMRAGRETDALQMLGQMAEEAMSSVYADCVKILVNGKEVFNQKISPAKNFMAKVFTENADRSLIWANKISIEVEK